MVIFSKTSQSAFFASVFCFRLARPIEHTYNLRREYVSENSEMEKLTLSAHKEVIQQARWLAKKNHTSVSAMFSRLVRTMAANEAPLADITPIAKRMSGIVKLPKGKTAGQLLDEALEEKYGREK
jgi:hypothetical protein